MHFDCNLSSIQKNPHLVSNSGFLLALKLHYQHIEQLRCRRFSKAASIRQNRDEYRAHSAHLDACRTQTKTGLIIITFTLTQRDEQLPSYKYVRLRSQYVTRDRCPEQKRTFRQARAGS